MEEKFNALKAIEKQAKELTEDTISIQKANYPLDRRQFLPIEARKKVIENDNKIKELAKKYLETFNSIAINERRGYNYQNIEGEYYQNTHQEKGLIPISRYSDEQEIHEAFDIAYSVGRNAIENALIAEKSKDMGTLQKEREVIDKCLYVFEGHPWGDGYIGLLNDYQKRLKSGRTNEQDIEEYIALVNEAKEKAIAYAQSDIKNEAEFRAIFDEYIKKTDKLLTFLPREIVNKIYVNLYWLRIDAINNPEKLFEEEQKGKSR